MAAAYAEEAAKALQEAEKAAIEADQATDIELANGAATTAVNAVRKATDSSKTVAGLVDAFRFIPEDFFQKAWASTVKTKTAAIQAGKTADVKAIKKKAEEAREKAEAKARPAQASKAKEAAAEVQQLADVAKKEFEEKRDLFLQMLVRLETSKHSVDAKELVRPEIIWMKSREKITKALEREYEALGKELEILQPKSNRFLEMADEAQNAVDKKKKEEEAKKREEAEEGRKRATEQAGKLVADAASGSFFGNAVAGVAATVGTIGISAWLTGDAGAIAGSGAVIGGVSLLRSEEAMAVSAVEIEALVRQVVEEAIVAAVEGAPVPPSGPLVLGPVFEPPMKRALVRDTVATKPAGEKRANAFKPVALRAVKAAVEGGMKQARLMMEL